MNVDYGLLPSYGVLAVILLMAGVPLLALHTREWLNETASDADGRTRVLGRYSLVALSVSIVTLGVIAAPISAQQLFTLPTEKGFEFYLVDKSLKKPSLNLTEPNQSTWPGLHTSRFGTDVRFIDSETKESSLLVDPGFRTSLTNRIVTVAGRIDWVQPANEFKMAIPFEQRDRKDIALQNLERLTGTPEIVWQIAPDGMVVQYE